LLTDKKTFNRNLQNRGEKNGTFFGKKEAAGFTRQEEEES